METWDGLRLGIALAHNRRAMRLPFRARCKRCHETNVFALVMPKPGGRILCYRCQSLSLGRSGIEWHHLGRRPSPLRPVPIDANLHRVLSMLQLPWVRAGISRGSELAVFWDLLMLALLLPGWER